ncbi:MAG: hypothetical protein IKM34_07355 [Clostridia bacterium]|nr:hypothetical protein [Clostridia bacterium]
MGVYRGRYDRQTPPGYSGVAFSEKQEDKRENSPTPVENGAGENKQKMQNMKRMLSRPPFSGASTDRRNEIKTKPRDFSGTVKESAAGAKEMQVPAAASVDKKDLYESLSSFLEQKFSLEELLLIGTALVLATKEEKGEVFPVFALALMLLGS